MRHVRILNLFISSILPTPIKIQYKSIATCVGCGKFQAISSLYQKRNYTQLIDPNTVKKYATAHINSRPAEPSIAINKLSTQGRSNEALAIYLKLLGEGGFPSKESLYQLIRGLYRSNNLIGMYAVHDTLISFYNNKPPSKRASRAIIYMYSMLINLIANNTRPVDMTTITQLCREMKQFNGKSNIVLYNTLIKSLLKQGQIESAQAMFRDLKRNTTPTMITFGILMKDASTRNDLPSLLTYLDEIEQLKLIPDYAIVSILVTTLCKLNQFDAARDLVERLHKLPEASSFLGTKFKLQLLQSIQVKRINNKN